MEFSDLALTALIFAVAVLYSSVGHAGASGYLAAMALFNLDSSEMKPAALLLNILVSIVGSYKFWRAGHFRWQLFWPFAITSIPASFVGGMLTLPVIVYKPLVALVLLYSAWRMTFSKRQPCEEHRPPRISVCLAVGLVMGFLSGLVGVGGGIFLSPLLLLWGWANIRETAAVSVVFILVNSISGVLGVRAATEFALPALFAWWIPLVVVGGYAGAHFGSRRLNSLTLHRLLAVVLVIGSAKLILETYRIYRDTADQPTRPQTSQSS